jgi:hypothetical protein
MWEEERVERKSTRHSRDGGTEHLPVVGSDVRAWWWWRRRRRGLWSGYPAKAGGVEDAVGSRLADVGVLLIAKAGLRSPEARRGTGVPSRQDEYMKQKRRRGTTG